MRRLVAWAEAVKAKVPPADAFRAAVLNQYDNSNREVIRQLEQSHVKYETINRYMTAVSDEDRKIIGEIARGERFNDAAVDKETGDIL